METKVWIILASVLGLLVLLCTLTLILFCWKRSSKKLRRGFSIRAVTPLDDAEFESWRRPSQYTTRPEKYGIQKTQPPARIRTPPPMWEKEIGLHSSPRTPSPTPPSNKTHSAVRMPERARRKSSVSIADRPPTPYSPSSTTGEFPRRGSRASHGSPRTPRHLHYPSMSDTSDLHFDFGFDTPLIGTDRYSNQPNRSTNDR